jgi:hypothetical protein
MSWLMSSNLMAATYHLICTSSSFGVFGTTLPDFQFKLPMNGADISKRIVATSFDLCLVQARRNDRQLRVGSVALLFHKTEVPNLFASLL